MNSNRTIIAVLAFCALSLVSCKKKEEETTSFTFLGNIEIEEYIPSYVTPGQVIKMTPSGVRKDSSDPDTPVIKYSFLAQPFMTKRDTTDQWVYTIPDSLCTIRLSIYASAAGYYSQSSEYEIVIIDPATSLSNLDYDQDGGVFTDPRDSRKYPYTQIAGKDWMERNLAYCGFGKAYMSIEDSGYDAMTDVFGMYYTWEEANKACPEGWRLPSDQDWTDMCQTLTDTPLSSLQTFPGIAPKLMSNARLNDQRLWTYYTISKPDPTASYINLLPVGFANISEKTYYFESSLSSAAHWTSTEADADKAYARYFYNNSKNADVQAQPLYKEFVATTIRCIRDSE
ncbi:MAG: hypothetical protein IKI70_01655 [Bacteroidales bacterium]|nr:hypothetical protein [Bacteroidales bacterium]